MVRRYTEEEEPTDEEYEQQRIDELYDLLREIMATEPFQKPTAQPSGTGFSSWYEYRKIPAPLLSRIREVVRSR